MEEALCPSGSSELVSTGTLGRAGAEELPGLSGFVPLLQDFQEMDKNQVKSFQLEEDNMLVLLVCICI